MASRRARASSGLISRGSAVARAQRARPVRVRACRVRSSSPLQSATPPAGRWCSHLRSRCPRWQIAYLRYGSPSARELGAAGHLLRRSRSRLVDARDDRRRRRAVPAAVHVGLLDGALAERPAGGRQRPGDGRREHAAAARPRTRLGGWQSSRGPRARCSCRPRPSPSSASVVYRLAAALVAAGWSPRPSSARCRTAS